MRVVKNIHNNISICLDSKGNEVVAFGKGIGFKKPPYEISVGQIERTFYNINPIYIQQLSQIPESIIKISTDILDYANDLLEGEFSANIIFTLADHIMFSIKRQKEKIVLDLPHLQEVKFMYPKEIQIGEYALALIKKKLQVELPIQEAAVITLHVIDYGLVGMQPSLTNDRNKIDACCDMIEACMGVKIDKEGFSYSRFVSHMYYLLDRISNNEKVKTKNKQIFDTLIDEYPKTYECTKKIAEKLNLQLNEEEILYLILHVNRLISREEIQ